MEQNRLPEHTEPAAAPKKKHTAKEYAITFFVKLAVTAAVVFLLLRFVAGVYVCHDNASYPMIKDGDLCVTFRPEPLRQGDEIAFRQDGRIRFGRVIAFAGETVDIRSGTVTVDGYDLQENAVYATDAEHSEITFPYGVPEGCVFLLNDNRNDISDSRCCGGIPEKDSQGKIIFIMRRRGI